MDTKIDFFKIGLFVVTLFFLLLGFIFWLGKYGISQEKEDSYIIYFKESVSGLNVDSPVKFKGVEVGRIDDIKINPKNSEEIQITIKIKKDTPIKQDNFATLGTLGLTGLKYIELKGGNKQSELLKKNSEGLKIIASKTSVLTSLENSSEDITKELKESLIQIRKLFNNDNLKEFSQILVHTKNSLKNSEEFTNYLIQKEQHLNNMIDNIIHLTSVSSNSFETMQDAALSVKDSANKVKELSNTILLEFNKGTYDLKAISFESFNKLNNVLEQMEDTLINTQTLIENLKDSPSDILFKEKVEKLGPGE
ncbi:MlaD family protein [Malaciobacter mytili]|uniref:ABC transporter substrate-binding protein n=1 Tax=Malaciobacter mytili LMG 24559 TaxID=1032238 RepID=A0AAX2AHR7_9BACT|nr:MlaD family protein [Malaciobacter mytili]AXH13887.1 lipid asymmetry ABC transporter MlaABCDEF, periplasmic component MlaD [Malaciobacter mytili LMG 24559]RXI38283.1 ABC transporter substrate-binding protein [Malaciobacter mytili]RXK15741.1 ABC transporter substrate-binding protein [Malaciobacter mytili LMG 24559]